MEQIHNQENNKKEVIKYQGKMLEIIEQVQVVEGKDRVFEIARRAPGTRLIIENNDGTLLITKEFRRELQDYDYRLPGGKVFDTLVEYNEALESGEDMEPAIKAAALKEAKEEVGVVVNDVSKFAVSKCGATVDWDLHYFVLKDVEKGKQELEEGENIEIVNVTKEQAEEMCLNGQISEERSAMNLLKYLYTQK